MPEYLSELQCFCGYKKKKTIHQQTLHSISCQIILCPILNDMENGKMVVILAVKLYKCLSVSPSSPASLPRGVKPTSREMSSSPPSASPDDYKVWLRPGRPTDAKAAMLSLL